MKKLILSIFLVATTAGAGTVAMMKNNAGGVIVLTDVKCDKKSNIVYANAGNGQTSFGCWFIDENFVFVRWNDGEVRTYPFSDWTFKTKSYD